MKLQNTSSKIFDVLLSAQKKEKYCNNTNTNINMLSVDPTDSFRKKSLRVFFANNIPFRNCIVFFSNLHCDLNNAIEIPIVFDKSHRTYDG